MGVEVRRVQKLGASSLVVTIPKEWARRLGITVGSRVYLIDEGDSIRILPLASSEVEPVEIAVPPLPGAAGHALVCAYLSGLSEFRLKPRGASREVMAEIRERALNLLGVQVGEEDGTALIRVAVDPDRLDVPQLLRSLASDAESVIQLLIDAVRLGGCEESCERELEVLERDFMRNQHALIRYLITRRGGAPGPVTSYYTALAAGYLGFAFDLLDGLLRMLPMKGSLPLASSEASLIAELLGALREAVGLEARILASPSLRRAGELLLLIGGLREKMVSTLSNIESVWAAVIISKMHDISRVLTLSAYVALCNALIAGLGSRRV